MKTKGKQAIILDINIKISEKDISGDECENETRILAKYGILKDIASCMLSCFHYKEAIKICDFIIGFAPKAASAYLLKAQSIYHNLGSSIK